MSDKKQLKEAIKREYAKCATDPVYFLGKYGIIQHPVRGKVNFVFVLNYNFFKFWFADTKIKRFVLLNFIFTFIYTVNIKFPSSGCS